MRTSAVWVCCAVLATAAVSVSGLATAQAPASQAAGAPAASRVLGTVKSVSAGSITVSSDKGETTTVSLPDAVRVVQLPPGSTDLKTAQPATAGDIAVGDRVLVTARPGDAGAVSAARVVLMKSGAIAATNAERQQDWQRRGSAGTVASVDSTTHALALTAGKRTETVTTTPSTTFRRYAPGSVKFEEAKLSTLADIHTGDQVRVRGEKAADGSTIAAEEIVSGAFRNIAGLVTKVDPAANTITLNDLATKKPVTVSFSADSDLRSLPPEMAARFAARAGGGGNGARPAGAGAAGAAGTPAPGSEYAPGVGTRPAGGPPSAGGQSSPGGQSSGNTAGGEGRGGYGAGRGGYGGGARQGGGDLSQVIGRLPKQTVAELKPGEAVMVVASGDSAAGSSLTAITLLSGVEPLLAAAPQGSANSFSLSPWSLGGGGGEGGGEGPQ